MLRQDLLSQWLLPPAAPYPDADAGRNCLAMDIKMFSLNLLATECENRFGPMRKSSSQNNSV